MIGPGLIYLALSAILFTIAAVTHFHLSALSSPLPGPLTILTAILPILGLVNAYIRPNLLVRSKQHQHQHQPSTLSTFHRQNLPQILTTLHLLLSTALLTILAQYLLPSSPLTRCTSDAQWMALFRSRNGEAIRAVQDALSCCGYNSVRDRAFPFGQPSRCGEMFGREESCGGAWRGMTRSGAGADVGVVLGTVVIQLLALLLLKPGTSFWTAWHVPGWPKMRGPSSSVEQSRRPLLTGAEEVDEEEEEEGEREVEESRRGYGTGGPGGGGGQGSRVEPSGMRTVWEE